MDCIWDNESGPRTCTICGFYLKHNIVGKVISNCPHVSTKMFKDMQKGKIMQEEKEYKKPGLIDQAKSYLEARQKWADVGKPTRTPEKMQELYNICKGCEHFKSYYCGICLCFINLSTILPNKLYWSTTRCPLEELGKEPKWIEEPEYQPVKNQPPPPKAGDCGCSKRH